MLKHTFLCIFFGSLLFVGEPFFVSLLSTLDKETIVISSDDIDQMSIEFQAQAGRLPDEEDVELLIKKRYQEEILFNEALELKLYQFDTVIQERLSLNMSFLEQGSIENMDANQLILESERNGMLKKDIVVRRRMIERMQKVISSRFVVKPTDDVLKEYLQANVNTYKQGKRIKLLHVFISNEKSKGVNVPEIFDQWKSGVLDDKNIFAISLNKYVAANTPLSEKSLVKLFGEKIGKEIFAQDVFGAKVMHQTAFGYHLVKVVGFESGHLPQFSLIKEKVLQDYLVETQKQAVSHSLKNLEKKYALISPERQVM